MACASSAASMDGESRSDCATLESNRPSVRDIGPDRPDRRESPPETTLTEAEVTRILRATPLVVTNSNRAIVEPAMKNAAKYAKYSNEYWKRIEDLNSILPSEDKFFPVSILPRCPDPPCFFPWYGLYSMEDSNPTSLRSKRFTEPGSFDYPVLTMLQIFSVEFVGNLVGDQSMLIYGIIAIRDELDGLRNCIFNRSREHPHKITPDSSNLPMISPARGNSVLDGVLLEYNLRVKAADSNNTERDSDIIDGCIEFTSEIIRRGVLLKSRIYGMFGPVDISYAFLKQGNEATIDIVILKAAAGWGLKAMTAFTSGYEDGIVLYDGPAFAFSPPKLHLTPSVVAVELGRQLMLRFEITFNDRTAPKQSRSYNAVLDGEVEPKIYRQCVSFTSKKYSCDSLEVVVGSMFKAEVSVTWSTMGPY